MAQSADDSCGHREVALKVEDGDADDGSRNLRSSSKELKVSFKGNYSSEDVRRRHKESPAEENSPLLPSPTAAATAATSGRGRGRGECEGEVLVCSGNASFRRKSLGFSGSPKPKSRLMDSPAQQNRKSGKMAKSGGLGNPSSGDEEDDLLDEDIPEEYKKAKFSALNVLQWASLILITLASICSLWVPVLRKQRVWDLHIWKWGVMGLVLICGRLVSGWGIRVAVFFIERNFLLRKRVLYFVYGLRKAVQDCLWLGLVLIAWNCIFDDKVEEETHSKILPYVTKVLVCLLVGTSIWLVKTLLVKVLALSFHVSTFFERIQESLFNQYVIETLSGPPLIELQEEVERVVDEMNKTQNVGRAVGSGRIENSPKIGKSPRFSVTMSNKEDEEITIDHLYKLNQRNVSAWNMKRLMNIVRHGALYTLDERILNSDIGDESSLQIRSECQARKVARKIFCNVARMGSRYIYVEDLMHFMREDEALKTMHLFDGVSKCHGISKASLRNWMVNAFRERRALALSLNDTNTAVDKLHHLLSILVAIIVVIIGLLIIGIPIIHFLVVISSQILLMAFIFGNTCKTMFEAIIFLFVVHPFDVGDRCEVEGVQLVVEEMNILTTVFLRYDNQKIVYPNSVLATKPISNYYRSPDMGDAIDFCIHIATPMEKIATMKERIKRCIERKNDHWLPDPMVVMKDVEGLNRLRMAVWFTHRMNHHDMGERWTRRALLVQEIIEVFRELDIEYRLLPLDVNVKHMPGSISNGLPSNLTTDVS
ncbi:mechanosensitive ion channel protein 6-like [Malania oleifera]|uniref:mechanosensitive ion channel protein 6-like n=1 Tax=Malania oleifera TaxID=397392 RepID=UPI0025ADD6E9|nr:mechanosensitive ion channel protein 6-like [Malania oleifera]